MRLLQIDVGNSRIKWRLLAGGEPVILGCGEEPDSSIFESLKCPTRHPERIQVATVANDRIRETLTQVLGDLFGEHCMPEFICTRQCYQGVSIAYPDTKTLGVDRWLGLLAAHRLHQGDQIIVDAGSAITIDYLKADGGHLGGYILPGLQMMKTSLVRSTALVRFDGSSSKAIAPGRSTAECVLNGSAWLLGALVARLNQEREALHGGGLIVTGGDAPAFLSAGLVAYHHPDLVFEGMDGL